MAFYLTLESAADFWRLVYSPHKVPNPEKATIPKSDASSSASMLRECLPEWANCAFTELENGKLHLLVTCKENRNRASSVNSHLWKGTLPQESFYRLNDKIYVASPEFTFLHMASICNLSQLMAYGCEICGRYSFDPREERGFRMRDAPLTSTRELRLFLESVENVRGRTKALRAIEHVIEGAESPMETTTALLLCLPYRYGGYGLSKPNANVTVPLTREAYAILHQRECRIDMLWNKERLAVEFLGKLDHDGESAFEHDRKRTNALAEMGYEVIELTNGQVRDYEAFELIAKRIARMTGKRIAPQYKGQTPTRRLLRNTLSAWNAAYGRP